jgi:hypothetical protein
MATLETYRISVEPKHPDFAQALQQGLEQASDFCKVQPAACKNNLGIPRAKMPQIQRAKTPEFLNSLKDQGVKVTQGKARVGDLRATQREINARKVAEMIQAAKDKKFDPGKAPVIVSSDQHILDGHHRWAALIVMDPKSTIPVRRVELPMRELLRRAHNFEGVKYRSFEARVLAAVADLVGPFKVGDEILYGKYKNKRGKIIAFGQNHKGQITVEIEPIPKGRKQNKTIGLFKIWTIETATSRKQP